MLAFFMDFPLLEPELDIIALCGKIIAQISSPTFLYRFLSAGGPG